MSFFVSRWRKLALILICLSKVTLSIKPFCDPNCVILELLEQETSKFLTNKFCFFILLCHIQAIEMMNKCDFIVIIFTTFLFFELWEKLADLKSRGYVFFISSTYCKIISSWGLILSELFLRLRNLTICGYFFTLGKD